MALSNIAGFPRIGDKRELKFATERYWRKKITAEELHAVAADIRRQNWQFLKDSGVDLIPSNDFSYYDQMLDAVALVGAVPDRYGFNGGEVDLDTYFAMARGRQEGGIDVIAMEMIKWFDTNYHYIVPELGPDTRFALSTTKPFDEYEEAKKAGLETTPVLIGPVTFLLMGKSAHDVDPDFDRLTLLEPLLSVYEEVIGKLGRLGAQWIQLDEPAFVMDRTAAELEALRKAYERLAAVGGRPKIVVKTYFDHAADALPVLAGLPIEGIGLDFVQGLPTNESLVLTDASDLSDKTLFAGVVDGTNIWINDLTSTLERLQGVAPHCGELVVSTSASLIYTPIDLGAEPDLDDELKSWLAFARQKVAEVVALTRGLNQGRDSIKSELEANANAIQTRKTAPRTFNRQIRDRVGGLEPGVDKRKSPYEKRRKIQSAALGLPLFPTTTIGSYPQTLEIRKARAAYKKGELTEEQYLEEMRKDIAQVVAYQEEAGLDVLVHGEAERNDMVQYFAEMLEGCAFTVNGWVQSYGSRYTRPPIIFGDIRRPEPMTVEWITYAQTLTSKPMKGMLTGPVTMLEWSFVREDIPTSETCKQMALALRDEVNDLEAAGIRVIQVDEPAIREGLPLRKDRWTEYLEWATYCFRLTVSGVKDETQIQTHLCYSEFGDIINAIDEMDADVALMWCARAGMRLLDQLQEFGYKREVGPGVYDIHSPRVPSVDEMTEEIREATKRLDLSQIWINPDCGLKTRGWEETAPAVKNMVEAAHKARSEFSKTN